jgi:hypothetical protein
LQVDVEDDQVEAVFTAVEAALTRLSPIELQYRLPEPIWHGHSQTFYRLQAGGPFMFLDFVVIKHSSTDKLIQYEIHGEPVVHFDKKGVVQSPPFDAVTHAKVLQQRIETLQITFDLFQVLTLKEVKRNNHIEALAFYQNFSLRPLVELLRIKHAPLHYNFYTRYIYYDLPKEMLDRLEPLFFVVDPVDLEHKRQQVEDWFYETLEGLRNNDEPH